MVATPKTRSRKYLRHHLEMGRARNTVSTDVFAKVLGTRRGVNRTLTLVERVLGGDGRDERELQNLISAFEYADSLSALTDLTPLIAQMIAVKPQLLTVAHPRDISPEALLHSFFNRLCREHQQKWLPVTTPLLRLCGYPQPPQKERDNSFAQLFVASDYWQFHNNHRRLLTADLLQTIRATNIGAREREVAQLLEISPTPRPLPWLEPALNYTFIQAFLQLTTEAAGDNPTTTLRRALGPQGFSRLAKRQHIGSVKNLNAAARALRLEWWRDAFTQVIDHPTPTCYPGPQCDPTNPLPDFQERQRRLEMTLAPLLQVPH